MKYLFLTNKFYNEYDALTYPEILRKIDRPYIMLQVVINGIDFALSLRSNIQHKNCLWTNKQDNCGVDYSKAVIIPDATYIDVRQPVIRPFEHKALIGKEFQIKNDFEKYIKDYTKAVKYARVNNTQHRYSTLQYYHQELNINP